jgi:hypothetical protein
MQSIQYMVFMILAALFPLLMVVALLAIGHFMM